MAFSAGGVLANPIVQGLMALLSMGQQNRSQNQYEADANQQIADALRIFGNLGPETLRTYDDSAGKQVKGYEDLIGATGQNRQGFLNEFNERGRGLLQGYQDRYAQAAHSLEGYGGQQRADVDRYFQKLSDQASQTFPGSTVANTLQANISDQRNAEQRRLGEDLTRMRVGILSGLSGEQLAAQGGLDASHAAYDMALRGDVLGAQRALADLYGTNAVNRSNIVNQGIGAFGNTLAGINLTPPPPNQLPFMFGQNSVQMPSAPSWLEQNWGNLLGAGIGAGGNVWGSSMIANALR